MGKGPKSSCRVASHQLLKDKAKNRVEDLQLMFIDLQFARKESRTGDVAVLEEQLNQMLCEWKAELNEPTPASSLREDSLGSFSSEFHRLLRQCEEEDDATSPLTPPTLKHGTDVHAAAAGDSRAFKDFSSELFIRPNNMEQCGGDAASDISGLLPNINLPPSAYLGPKCALWDCPRPVQGSEWCMDYCSTFHAALALQEGPPGMAPVLRPGGIGLKDNLLFTALRAKTQGKVVGIPECEGAATAKCPWNAPEFFDISVLEGETIREWLFFDKPRRAFESGTRKQRSLPDYSGRGWHESRKQVMKEFGGLKRSYYMDPQPLNSYEWHLFEYEIDNYDGCALYRLELKLADGKKSPKGKVANDSLVDLQKRMGRLTADVPADNKCPLRGKAKSNMKPPPGDIPSSLSMTSLGETNANASSHAPEISLK
ncbi:hypothetical protein Ancab_007772 [Ancistrocladus abbreviatus]